LHTEVHWLSVLEHVNYKLSIMRFGCLCGQGPKYPSDRDFCLPVSTVATDSLCFPSVVAYSILIHHPKEPPYRHLAISVACPTLCWTICVNCPSVHYLVAEVQTHL